MSYNVISLVEVADKINKNNVNVLEYKKITKQKGDVDFFECCSQYRDFTDELT